MRQATKLFTDLCKRFAAQSQCRSRQVGCIIVRDSRIIGQGFNGAPSGSACSGCKKCNENTCVLADAICAHAEANALAMCARFGIAVDGADLWCTHKPCTECAKLIIGAGIKRVFYIENYGSDSDVLFAGANVNLFQRSSSA